MGVLVVGILYRGPSSGERLNSLADGLRSGSSKPVDLPAFAIAAADERVGLADVGDFQLAGSHSSVVFGNRVARQPSKTDSVSGPE